MRLDIQYKIRENRIYLDYLHSHSYWYKYLNRNSNYFDDFVEKVKEEYHLRPIDTLDMVSSIISTLNS